MLYWWVKLEPDLPALSARYTPLQGDIGGNATAVAISNTYNPDNRTASDAVAKLGIQLGVNMAGNILKELRRI